MFMQELLQDYKTKVMKGIIKYVLIAAVGYFIYNQYRNRTQLTIKTDRPTGSGGMVRSQDVTQLESLQGIKKLPYTY